MSDQALSGQLISSRPALTFRDGGNYWLGSSACRLSLTIHHDHDSWFIVIGFHRRPAGLGKTKRQAIHRNQSNRCVQALLEALNRPSSRFRLPLMIVLCGLAGAHRSRCQNGQTMAAIPNRSLKRQIRRVNCLSKEIGAPHRRQNHIQLFSFIRHLTFLPERWDVFDQGRSPIQGSPGRHSPSMP